MDPFLRLLAPSACRRARVAACLVAVPFIAGLGGCAAQAPVPPASIDAAAPAAYMIGPGDRLGIFVYDQPQLSESELPVRPDGRISTPLVPDVQAAGRTPSELADSLAGRLRQYVKDPKVTVMVHEAVGGADQQIRVVGEAATPLALPYHTGMTVLDLMIQTHGLTRFAAGNRAAILRRGGPGAPATRIAVHLSDLLRDGDLSQNLPLQPGDTLVIPQSWF